MKTISFTLDPESVEAAIQELNRFQKEFGDKLEKLRIMVAERIQWSAQQGFSNAIVSDVVRGSYVPSNDVKVTVSHNGDVSVVIAEGSQAVFIEYGAGVYHNGGIGMVGQSPHPWVQDGTETRPFFIGMYGDGKGARDAWGFYNGGKSKSNLVITRGTPAAMPMYRGWMEAVNAIGDMVREVFG